MVGWLVGCLVGLLVGWLVGWLVCWLIYTEIRGVQISTLCSRDFQIQIQELGPDFFNLFLRQDNMFSDSRDSKSCVSDQNDSDSMDSDRSDTIVFPE